MHKIGNATIRVYANDHLPPHFHVEAPDDDAQIEIASLKLLAGSLPGGSTGRAIRNWIEEHRAEIVTEWNRINPKFPA